MADDTTPAPRRPAYAGRANTRADLARSKERPAEREKDAPDDPMTRPPVDVDDVDALVDQINTEAGIAPRDADPDEPAPNPDTVWPDAFEVVWPGDTEPVFYDTEPLTRVTDLITIELFDESQARGMGTIRALLKAGLTREAHAAFLADMASWADERRDDPDAESLGVDEVMATVADGLIDRYRQAVDPKGPSRSGGRRRTGRRSGSRR